jgi:DNA-binding LacI/PurR family transcriptional regulator
VKINQKYIADLLNISRVTVTKALQNHPDIALSTREKVKKVADELGYIPNIVGRSLSTKKTNTIGVIVPKINHSFFSTIIEELYSNAKKVGYNIILMVSFENEEAELDNVKSLLSMNVDGIIIDSVATSQKHKVHNLLNKHNKSFIYLDRKPVSLKNAIGVFFDDENLSYQLTKEIINKGFTKLMFISGNQEISISKHRLNGFNKAVKEAHISVPEEWCLVTKLDKTNAEKDFSTFLENYNNLPEVVICANDSIAIGVYNACEKFDVKIPDDIAVSGFGHVKISSLLNPPLTTVKLNLKKAAEKALENLLLLINNKPITEKTLIEGKIIFRESTEKK